MSIFDRKVTVCDKCHTACCWHGRFMCDAAHGAGLIDMTIAELKALNGGNPMESPEFWFTNPADGVIDQQGLAEYRSAFQL